MKVTITKKLLAAKFVTLLFMLVVAGVGYWCIEHCAVDVARILKETKVSGHSYGINSESLELRRFEKDMFLNCQDKAKREEYEVKWRGQLERIDKEMTALLQILKIQQDRDRVTRMQAGVKKYTTVMDGILNRIRSGELKMPAECNGALTEYKNEIREVDDISLELVQQADRRMEAVSTQLSQTISTGIVLIVTVSLAMIVIAIAFALFISRRLTAPLRQMMAFLDVAEKEGDLTKRVEIQSRDEIGDMGQWLNRFLAKVHDVVSSVKATASEVANASQQLAAAAEELSSGAQEQASSLEETAASLEQVTSSVKQNSDNAQQANQLATASRNTAEKGGQIITSTVTAMGEINQSSRKITDIISTIDEIAFQTNLLALNAAVEAARAGDQGRGFAVVASEVRNLAQRSATAAKEIKVLIQDSVKKVDNGSGLVAQSGQALEEIVTSVRRVRDLVTEIASSSLEQSTGINQVNQAVAQMDNVVQQNSSQTEELSSTAQSLADQSQTLEALISQFKVSHDRAVSIPMQPTSPASRVIRKRQGGQRLSLNGGNHPGPITAVKEVLADDAPANARNGFEEF